EWDPVKQGSAARQCKRCSGGSPSRLALQFFQPLSRPSLPARCSRLLEMDKRPMQQSDWRGVMPAITTPFTKDLAIDHGFLAEHVTWLIDSGCRGIVAPGSLGEGATLTPDEKRELLRTIRRALNGRGPLIAAVSALSTNEAVAFSREAAEIGCDGLMVL